MIRRSFGHLRAGPPQVDFAHFVAFDLGPFFDKTDSPPTGIAAEERHVAALPHICFYMVTHLRRPILMMSREDHKPVLGKGVPILMYVEIRTDVELIPLGQQPTDEGGIPMKKAMAR